MRAEISIDYETIDPNSTYESLVEMDTDDGWDVSEVCRTLKSFIQEFTDIMDKSKAASLAISIQNPSHESYEPFISAPFGG